MKFTSDPAYSTSTAPDPVPGADVAPVADTDGVAVPGVEEVKLVEEAGGGTARRYGQDGA
jgi:hypothetical protein